MSVKKALQLFFLFLCLACFSTYGIAQQTDTTAEDVHLVDSTTDEDYTEEEVEFVDTILSLNLIYFPKDSLRLLLRQKEFSYISNLDSLLKKVQQEQLLRFKKQKPPANISWIFYFFEYLLWFIVIGSVVFLIYRLFLSQKGIFAPTVRNRHKNTNEEEVTDEDGLSRKAKEAEQAGNYRLAVRYHYLHALTIIAHKGWLVLSPDKTNYQYVKELSNKVIRNDFARITLHYEYAWYGNFEIDAVIFQTIKKQFATFQIMLKQS